MCYRTCTARSRTSEHIDKISHFSWKKTFFQSNNAKQCGITNACPCGEDYHAINKLIPLNYSKFILIKISDVKYLLHCRLFSSILAQLSSCWVRESTRKDIDSRVKLVTAKVMWVHLLKVVGTHKILMIANLIDNIWVLDI